MPPNPSPATAALAKAAAASTAEGGGDANFEALPETTTAPQQELPPSYYTQGSTDIAIETPVLQQRLERRRRLTVTAGGGGTATVAGDRLLIVLVGLPARGKSYIGRKLQSYLNWRGNECQIFNVGKYRRQVASGGCGGRRGGGSKDESGSSSRSPSSSTKQDASFFDDSNREAARLRQQAAGLALDTTLQWLHGLSNEGDGTEGGANHDGQMKNSGSSTSLASSSSSGSSSSCSNQSLNRLSYSTRRQYHRVAIFDATNSTQERRKWILEKCASFNNGSSSRTTGTAASRAAAVGVLFLESLCDDQALLEENYQVKIATCPDFVGMDRTDALNDLKSRIERYESRYETIPKDDPSSYIKIYNLGSRLVVNHVYGRLAKVVLPAIMAWNTGSRPIYLVRSGETTSMELYMNQLKTSASRHQRQQQRQHHDDEHGRAVQNRPMYRRNKSDRLGDRGNEFRRTLCQFIEKEGMDFMKRQTTQNNDYPDRGGERYREDDDMNSSFGLHHPCQMDTGTSISGLHEERDHRPFESYEDSSYSTKSVRRSRNIVNSAVDMSNDFSSSGCTPGVEDETSDDDDESKHESVVLPFPCLVMSSTMPRAIETVSWDKHPFPVKDVTNLNPLDMGDLSGLDQSSIRKEHPIWYNRLEQDPYNTRYVCWQWSSCWFWT